MSPDLNDAWWEFHPGPLHQDRVHTVKGLSLTVGQPATEFQSHENNHPPESPFQVKPSFFSDPEQVWFWTLFCCTGLSVVITTSLPAAYNSSLKELCPPLDPTRTPGSTQVHCISIMLVESAGSSVFIQKTAGAW